MQRYCTVQVDLQLKWVGLFSPLPPTPHNYMPASALIVAVCMCVPDFSGIISVGNVISAMCMYMCDIPWVRNVQYHALRLGPCNLNAIPNPLDLKAKSLFIQT